MDWPILDKLAEEYGFTQLTFLNEVEKGISARNVIVSAEDGSQLFVKNFKKTDVEKIDNSERVANYISENSDLPVVLPLKNKQGKSHVTFSGQTFSVFPYVENVQYSPAEGGPERLALVKKLGETLGKIHAVSMNVAIPEAIESISTWSILDQKKSVMQYEEIKKIIKEKDAVDEYDKKALEFIEIKTSLLEKRDFTKKDEQLLAVCHGDFHKGNILLNDKGGVLGICDWDFSGVGNPYLEFIQSFNMCIIRRDFEHLNNKKDATTIFFEGYASCCGFKFEMIELEYATEIWYQKLLTSNWPLLDHYYLNRSKVDNVLYSEYDKVVFLRDKRGELVELIRKCS